jgi:hypothetical protein
MSAEPFTVFICRHINTVAAHNRTLGLESRSSYIRIRRESDGE